MMSEHDNICMISKSFGPALQNPRYSLYNDLKQKMTNPQMYHQDGCLLFHLPLNDFNGNKVVAKTKHL